MFLYDPSTKELTKSNWTTADQKALELINEWESDSDTISTFTSGSTGKPKQIVLKKELMRASVQMSIDAFDLCLSDIFLCNLSTESIGGKMQIIRALELKSLLVFLSPSSDPISEMLQFENILNTELSSLILAFVPMQVESILKSPIQLSFLKKAKVILIGGAAISPIQESKLLPLELPIFATYGMTETITHVAIRKLGRAYFETLKGVEIEQSAKQTLRLKAPSTNNKWVVTNDIVTISEEGKSFKLLGRADNVINSGGVKLQIEEIEEKIKRISKVELFCFGLPDSKLGTKLCCAYLKSTNTILSKELLKGKMTKFEVPKVFFALENFKYTNSGKIDKLKTIDAYIEP